MAMEAWDWKREAGWSHGIHRQATESDGGRVISCATVGVRFKDVLSRGTVSTFARWNSRQNNTFPRRPKRAPDIAKCPLGGNSAPCWVSLAWLLALLAVTNFLGFFSSGPQEFFGSNVNLWSSHKPSVSSQDWWQNSQAQAPNENTGLLFKMSHDRWQWLQMLPCRKPAKKFPVSDAWYYVPEKHSEDF